LSLLLPVGRGNTVVPMMQCLLLAAYRKMTSIAEKKYSYNPILRE
jgi:hypothetical protein